jgi:hypothetical protein
MDNGCFHGGNSSRLGSAYLGPWTLKACAVAKKAAIAVVLENFIVIDYS